MVKTLVERVSINGEIIHKDLYESFDHIEE